MLSASSLRRFLVKGGQPGVRRANVIRKSVVLSAGGRIVEKIGVSNVVIDGRKSSERPSELLETVQFIFELGVLISL